MIQPKGQLFAVSLVLFLLASSAALDVASNDVKETATTEAESGTVPINSDNEVKGQNKEDCDDLATLWRRLGFGASSLRFPELWPSLWDPFRDTSFLQDVLSTSGMHSGNPMQVGIRTVSADESSTVLAVRLPGVPREKINISVDTDGVLSVEAQHTENHDSTGREEYHYYAKRQLPFGINTSKISAKYRDGVLKITVPKPKPENRTNVPVL
uniref:SHSP domain-containing protein n=1 Tax=Tetraselmis sp. GSL018 TaxID=582737 RepID=A0A061QRD8_9CHLO|eukprot:CAMPEP_0177621170 /NCGR_PEP_ID=MMETSP0419_2-20121207/27413_1 /TAXON_ID=582737 /ORGANISM="Tetraselmis sp., Strain GSL018" /LENGTH=211 /DNA_ID=CAMNT_0019121011 /DNA_START=267 /DNA_END=905 /DNA_ORIENTATION=+